MKNLDKVQHFDLEITRDKQRENIWLNQKTYIKILGRFNMKQCKPVATSTNLSQKLSEEQCPTDNAGNKENILQGSDWQFTLLYLIH